MDRGGNIAKNNNGICSVVHSRSVLISFYWIYHRRAPIVIPGFVNYFDTFKNIFGLFLKLNELSKYSLEFPPLDTHDTENMLFHILFSANDAYPEGIRPQFRLLEIKYL